jgi:hypothetical protein
MNTMGIGIWRGARRVIQAGSLLMLASAGLSAQAASDTARPLRVTAISGGLAHGTSLVVDPLGVSDTRLSPGATFGLEVQHATFSFASIFGGVSASFSTLEHGANLSVAAGPGSTGATIILGTAGLVFEATDRDSLDRRLESAAE